MNSKVYLLSQTRCTTWVSHPVLKAKVGLSATKVEYYIT